jgi:membrane-associated phospholipid phosphatase
MQAVQSIYVDWGTEQVQLVQALRNPVFDGLATWLTQLGEAPALLILALGVLVFHRGGRSLGFWIVAAFLLASGVNAALKDVLSVPRPDTGEVWTNATHDGYSTPSAHTMIAASVWMLAAFSWGGGRARYLLMAAPVVVAGTRVYLGAHYPGDVLLGLAFGTAIAAALAVARSQASVAARDLWAAASFVQARATTARLVTATLALLTARA